MSPRSFPGRGRVSAFPSPARQRGQALVLSIFVVGIVILVMVTLYSMGQQTINKIRLQNTADAAAYSAAVAQARDYNFSAYTNRAMVANQVAVAQFVGLTSWIRNYGTTYNGPFSSAPKILTSLGVSPFTYLWTVPWSFHKTVSKNLKSVFDGVLPKGIVATLDYLIDFYGVAQKAYHYSTAWTIAEMLGVGLQKLGDGLTKITSMLGLPAAEANAFSSICSLPVIDWICSKERGYDVIKMNDPDAQLSTPGTAALVVSLVQWLRFTEQKDPNTAAKDGADADRFASVARNSLDGFSLDRRSPDGMYTTWGGFVAGGIGMPPPFVIDPTRLIPYQNGPLFMWLWHRGGTELKQVSPKTKRTWSALDATGFTGLGFFWFSILGIPIPFPIPILFMPIGWGAAQAGVSGDLNPTNNFATSTANAYGAAYSNVNTAGAAMMQRGAGAGPVLSNLPWSDGGLRPYFDVKDVADNTKTAFDAPPLVLEIEKSGQTIADSNTHVGGRFTLTPGTQSNAMRALSKSQAYFSRPSKLWSRADGKTELGSLYNPYWQPRLIDNSFAERYISMSWHLL